MSKREFIELGPVPSAENCFQVGKEDFTLILKEAHIFKCQLERQFPTAEFSVKSFSHDFGRYCEVVVYLPEDANGYEPEDAIREDFDENGIGPIAYEVDKNLPEHWDDIAKAELAALKAGIV